MKLQHLKVHMRGQAILCNGVHYKVDSDGIIEVEDADDAKRLMASPDCVPYKAPQKAQKTPQAAPKPQPKPAPPKEPKAPEPAVEAVSPEPEPDDDGETGLLDEEGQDAGDQGEAPEWPDPDMSMTKAYLQEMADAYEVEHNPAMTKKDLIEAIMEKMYE